VGALEFHGLEFSRSALFDPAVQAQALLLALVRLGLRAAFHVIHCRISQRYRHTATLGRRRLPAGPKPYIGGRWQMFDPRNNVARIGRVEASCRCGPCGTAARRTWPDRIRRSSSRGRQIILRASHLLQRASFRWNRNGARLSCFLSLFRFVDERPGMRLLKGARRS
jgi:hypothetical protein